MCRTDYVSTSATARNPTAITEPIGAITIIGAQQGVSDHGGHITELKRFLDGHEVQETQSSPAQLVARTVAEE